MTTLGRICAPDLDISVDLPSGWVANPQRLDLFARPADAKSFGEKKLLACALTIQDVEWFRFDTKDKPEGASSRRVICWTCISHPRELQPNSRSG